MILMVASNSRACKEVEEEGGVWKNLRERERRSMEEFEGKRKEEYGRR